MYFGSSELPYVRHIRDIFEMHSTQPLLYVRYLSSPSSSFIYIVSPPLLRLTLCQTHLQYNPPLFITSPTNTMTTYLKLVR
jgi:hypothetical protein